MDQELLDVDLRSDSRRRTLIFTIVALAGLAVVAVLIYVAPKKEIGEKVIDDPFDDGFSYGEEALDVSRLKRKLAHDPCNKRDALSLGQKMNRAGNFPGAIEHVDAFLAKCGDYRRIKWVKLNAFRDLKDHEAAVEVGSELIKGRPTDSDYWWWRGEDLEKLGRNVQADADYRQSMALSVNKFAAWRMAKMLGKDHPCEGAFALTQLIEQKPHRVGKWGHDKLAELFLAGDCGTKRGTGVTKIALGPEPIIDTDASIGDQVGNFVVQTQAPFVVVTSDFAFKAGVDVSGPPVEHMVNGKLVTGVRVDVPSLAIGAAMAENVPAVVVDELPGGRDGLIGLSFLWRFQGTWEDDHLALRGEGRQALRGADGPKKSASQ